MLNVIASSFTIYAFEALKAELEKEEEVPLYQFSWVVLKSSKKDKAHFLLFLLFRLHGFEGVDGERGGDNI
jgi:hypothetical protein